MKNITTISFCSADTSEKIFVANFELDAKTMIDIKIENFVKIRETTTVDEFCFDVENVSSVIVNDLKIVVDNFDERLNFFFD